MIFKVTRAGKLMLAGVAALAIALPVIAQQAPESLLPPGFGDPVQEAPPTSRPGQPSLDPSVPPSILPPDVIDEAAPMDSSNAAANNMSDEEIAEEKEKYDFPDSARRLLTRIGPITPATGGLAPDAFGRSPGKFLATLMRQSKAPFASRWASILMRRTLLSATQTPGDINGADWTAERAWLLLRMGEADAARMLVQSVDANNYTPRLYAVAMQTYLATADPAGLCPLSEGALRTSSEPGWEMSRAICASFSGDQGMASSALNQAQRAKIARGIDFRLAEKVVGAGFNARRSVKIEWEGVDKLTAWRFGLATATNVPIPDTLYATVGPHVRAWEARAPMLSPIARRTGVETATRLGVFSGAALVDYYSELTADADVPADFQDRGDALRTAFAGSTPAARIEAMRTWWGSKEAGGDYTSLIALSRAAAALPVSNLSGDDVSHLIAAMLSAGYDRSAARWAPVVAQMDGDEALGAWGLLAVGTPSVTVGIDEASVAAYGRGMGAEKGRMLVAALAGLDRLRGSALQSATSDMALNLAPRGPWAIGIDAAARRGEQGTVALLAGVGMQVADWRRVPASHLYRIVSALHKVGLDPEARMIAAEALARS